MMQVISFRRLPGRRMFGDIDRAAARVARLARAVLRPPLAAWQRHRDENLLQALSDHQLRDLGISRADISHVVHHGRVR